MAEIKKKGSKEEVYEGKALCTAGGLKKEDLILNAKGKIVSKKRSEQGKKQIKNLENYKKSKKEENGEAGGELKEVKEEESEENEDQNKGEEEKKNNVEQPIIEEKKEEKKEEPYDPLANVRHEEKKAEEPIVNVIDALVAQEKIEDKPIKIPKAPKKKSKKVTQ